ERSSPVLTFSHLHGLGAKWRNPATGESQPDSAYAALKQERKAREEAETNRLLYVAMTRAEDRLFLTYTKTRDSRGWPKLVESAIPASCGLVQMPLALKNVEAEPVQFVDPPEVTGQHDSTAAVTDVAMFDDCPRRYFLGRFLGLEQQ